MQILIREFGNPEMHHKGWFRVFRAKSCIEIWFGKRYIFLGRD